MKKKSPDQPERELDTVIREQRKRIVDLRDENMALKARIERLTAERKEVTMILIEAEKLKAQIINEAHAKADEIISAAEKERKNSELAVKYHSGALSDLEVRCENILNSISRELNRRDGNRLRLVTK